MKTNIQNGFEYAFTGIPDLRCTSDGIFIHNNISIKKQWRTGQVFINISGKRYGIKTLRKLAYKTQAIEIPF